MTAREIQVQMLFVRVSCSKACTIEVVLSFFADNQYAQLLSTFGVEQRPAGWGKTVGVLKVAKRLLRKKEGGAGAQDTKPPTGFAALVSAMASKGGS